MDNTPLDFNRDVGRPPRARSRDDMDMGSDGNPDDIGHSSRVGSGRGMNNQMMDVPSMNMNRSMNSNMGGSMMVNQSNMMTAQGNMGGNMIGPQMPAQMMMNMNHGMNSAMMSGSAPMNMMSMQGGNMQGGNMQGSSMQGGNMQGGNMQGANMNSTMNMAGGFVGGNDYDFMMGDPFMMNQAGGNMAASGAHEVDGKEILHFNGFILVPPPPHAPHRSTRDKPPGCKTLFIGGLPETVKEEMIGELMQTCGDIETIRLGKKFFAHIRFTDYEAVDKAIFYSGWRMKIGDKDDKPNTGRIHCDYATARDDMHEWESMQRAIAREQRHQQRILEDMNRPPSPPQIVGYSENEAGKVTEMLKSSLGFMEAAKILTEWLDKGAVTNKTSPRFYTMLHSVSSAIRRLVGEKEEFECELENYKAQHKMKVTGITSQMEQIQSIFSKARQQKVWDRFSKPQRKNVDSWIKQCQDIRQKHDAELLAGREEDEMDLSDSEETTLTGPPAKRSKVLSNESGGLNNLKDENDSLKCQLEAYKNELDMNKQESVAEMLHKNKQIAMLQQTLKGMQEQLVRTRNEVTVVQKKCGELNKFLKDDKKQSDAITTPAATETSATAAVAATAEVTASAAIDLTEAETDTDTIANSAQSDSPPASSTSNQATSPAASPAACLAALPAKSVSEAVKHAESIRADGEAVCRISQQDGQILGLVVAFLHVHPYGASMDYIWSYLHRGGIDTKSSRLETLLETFPNMFQMKMCGVGVNFEKRWLFIGFPQGQ